MRYVQLGKTHMKVSHISFGASSLGGVFREVDESKAIEAVHVAIDLGINYIDVAPQEYPQILLLYFHQGWKKYSL
jgi:aryl-alcohol dehydrogenase-like predicted oxidoreductase